MTDAEKNWVAFVSQCCEVLLYMAVQCGHGFLAHQIRIAQYTADDIIGAEQQHPLHLDPNSYPGETDTKVGATLAYIERMLKELSERAGHRGHVDLAYNLAIARDAASETA